MPKTINEWEEWRDEPVMFNSAKDVFPEPHKKAEQRGKTILYSQEEVDDMLKLLKSAIDEDIYPHDSRCEGTMCYCKNRAKREDLDKWNAYEQNIKYPQHGCACECGCANEVEKLGYKCLGCMNEHR